jgi:hypothetical protein
VVVTPAMLERLDIPLNKLPRELAVRTAVYREMVPVAGVLQTPLPGRYDYVLPEALWFRLRRQTAAPRVDEVFSGPLPPAWAELDDVPPNVDAYLIKESLEWVGRKPRGSGSVWLFRSAAAQPPRLDLWAIHLENIGRRMAEKHGAAPASFAVPDPVSEVPRSEPAAPEGYDRVALHLADLDDLSTALGTARGLGYVPIDDRHEQIERIRKTTSRALALLTVVLVAVGSLVTWNLYVIQNLQAQQKLPEVGMLRAMGMGRLELTLIYLAEAGLLWLAGAGLGVAAGWTLGSVAEWWMGRDDPAAAVAFNVPGVWLAGIVAASLGICLGSTLLATRKARRSSPLECLGES